MSGELQYRYINVVLKRLKPENLLILTVLCNKNGVRCLLALRQFGGIRGASLKFSSEDVNQV